MTTTDPDILTTIPDANAIRREIAERAAQIVVLRKLLKAAESRNRLCPIAQLREVPRAS